MEESKIKRNHILLVLLFIVVLLIPVIVIKIVKLEENNKIKEEAVTFLKENINEIEPLCKDVLGKEECTRWDHYSICPKTAGVLVEETGLTTANWVLWYSNGNWYYQIKPIDDNDRIVITNEVK